MLAVGTWLLLSVTFVTGFVYVFTTLFYRKRRTGEPPIVKGNLILGSSVEFGKHAVNFLHKAREEYGDIFTIRLINQHLTILMDPHSYEAMHKEKNFDFEAIQRQVNWNVFSFVLKEPRKIIRDTAKTVKGPYLDKNMQSYTDALENAFTNLEKERTALVPAAPLKDHTEWPIGLREFTSATIFDPIFTTIFGRSDNSRLFNWRDVYRNFEVFHQYFNYMWLGFPKGLFPAVKESLTELLDQPTSAELLARSDSSDYIKTAIEYMLARGQSEDEIKGHNLVYLHVNYNTFRLAFWVLNNILMDKDCYEAITAEINEAVDARLDEDNNEATFTMADLEGLKVLDSVMNESLRLSSGVFMVRSVTKDTWFKTSADGKEHLIRGGDRIAIYPPAIHKDPEIFEEPLTFKHDRFIGATFYKNGQELRNPVMTFGSLCPGKRYALLQLRWYILSVFTRYNLRFPEGGQPAEYDFQYHGHEILPPVADVSSICTPRSNAPRLVFDRQ